MGITVGIRREDKNRWERRVPLTPLQVAELVREQRLSFRVQPSELRVFPDNEYAAAGAEIHDDIAPCGLVLGVKEIPPEKLLPGAVHVCFSHTIKGQPAGMPALARLLRIGATLVDYERITDGSGRRLIFFGRHAGHAGMLDALWALGQRLRYEGISTPFEHVRRAFEYGDLDRATDHVALIGQQIRDQGLSPRLRPIAVAFTGSGAVALGAQEVFDRLPFQEIRADELPSLHQDRERPRNVVFKIALERRDRVRRRDGAGFDARELARYPDRYESALEPLLPHLTMLVNGIYWEEGQPRLVTRAMLRRLFGGEAQPKLRVVADISCDVHGSVEANVGATDPGEPVYVYDPESGTARSGVEGRGPVVLAVDNLPCELPREASERFGDSLQRFVPALARCDWKSELGWRELPAELRRAVIAHRGELTEGFRYLEPALRSAGLA